MEEVLMGSEHLKSGEWKHLKAERDKGDGKGRIRFQGFMPVSPMKVI